MAQMKLIKSGKNFKMFNDGTSDLLLIENVRVSFPAVGHMKEDEGDDGTIRRKYNATPMLPKTTHVEAKNAFVEIMNKLLKENEAKVLPENRCIKNGDDTEREEYQEHWVIAASESRRPIARDARGVLYFDPEKIKSGDQAELIFDKIDGVFYGGVTVNILLRPWYFNGKAKGKTKTYPKRICCGFMGIQHVQDTPSFGQGRIDDTGVWGAVEGSDEGDNDLDGDDDL